MHYLYVAIQIKELEVFLLSVLGKRGWGKSTSNARKWWLLAGRAHTAGCWPPLPLVSMYG